MGGEACRSAGWTYERVGVLDPVLAANVHWLSDYKQPPTLLSSEFSEVAMGRPPEVFVRPVTMTEGQRLQRIGRTARDPVRLRRAIVVLMPAQGQSVPDIVHLLDCSQEYVRGVIRAFSGIGFGALDPMSLKAEQIRGETGR